MEGKTTRKEAEDKLRGLNEKVKDLSERLEREGNGRMIRQLKNQLKAAKIAADDLSLAMKLATSYEVSGITYDRMTGLPISGHEEEPKLTKFAPLVPDGGGGGDSEKVKMTAFELEIRDRIRQATLDENDLLVAQLNTILAIQQADLEKEDMLAKENAARDAVFKYYADLKTINEQLRKDAEKELKEEQEKAAALNEIKLITGDITQEEFDQEQIRQRAIELVKLFPGQFEAVHAALVEAASPLGKFKKGLKELFESAMDLKTALGEFAVQAVDSFGDAFADFVTTGKANFADFTASILRDLAKIFARAALFKALGSIPIIGDFLGLSKGGVTKGMTPPATIPGSVSAIAANGLAVAKNGIVPYAKGGLVTKPTLFQYKQGGVGSYGLMGEAGTEAIMPLRRGANGKLGVEASGGTSNVTVNVDASGSSVEGNGDQAAQLGKAIGLAVQQELIKQKRPGGLLTS
tara:strand:+ start:47 stop:1438 length:1392 start_codon:yes stop_codon:yes gene_type:complete